MVQIPHPQPVLSLTPSPPRLPGRDPQRHTGRGIGLSSGPGGFILTTTSSEWDQSTGTAGSVEGNLAGGSPAPGP